MQLVGHSLHPAGKLGLVRNLVPIFASASRPAIVENDGRVAHVSQAVINQDLGGLHEQLFVNLASEGVPVVLETMSAESILSRFACNHLPNPCSACD